MKRTRVIILALSAALPGCAPRLGAHVHEFRYRGYVYDHCTVVGRKDEPNLSHAALQICQDALEHPEGQQAGKK